MSATGRADGRPYVHAAKYSDDTLDYALPLNVVLQSGDGAVQAVSISAAPSGLGELRLLTPTVDVNAIWVTLSGGQPGRIYVLKYLLTLGSGEVHEVLANITIARVLVTDQPAAPPATDFGGMVTWSATGAALYGVADYNEGGTYR
jgi:hypothetical protein